MVKTMKYQIIKPMDIDWKLFGQILYSLQRETRNIKNKTSQLCWEYNGFSADYKEQYNKYPKPKEVLGYTNMMGYAYNILKDQYTKMNTGNLSATIKNVTDKWKNDTKAILKGETLPPIYKKNQPIDLANKSITIIKEGNDYYANLSLLSNTYKKELNLSSGQVLVLIKVSDNTQKVILERILSGEYKIGASKIQSIKKGKIKWFLNLSYKFEPQQKRLSEENIMGIDMGIVYPVYIAFNNSLHRYKIEGGEIENFRKQVERRKNQLLKQGKYCGDGRRGHGTLTRMKPIQKMQNKVANFRDTTNHKYSRYIIDLAIKHNCGVIQMEDLSGISKDNVFLKNWSYYDLQQKITYKAEEVGIEVRLINPKYTSQRCSKCGYIHKDNRPKQKTFKCQNCGFKVNADYNAAKNIATPGIEKIIEEQLKKQQELQVI